MDFRIISEFCLIIKVIKVVKFWKNITETQNTVNSYFKEFFKRVNNLIDAKKNTSEHLCQPLLFLPNDSLKILLSIGHLDKEF